MLTDSGPEISALLGDGASDGRSLHLSLGVDDNTCEGSTMSTTARGRGREGSRRTGVVLEVEEDTVTTAPRLALTDDDCGVN
jgi:hypothetical protein